MASAILGSCEGFATGYMYAFSHGKAEEVRQGKNEYIASLYQTGEITCLCSVLEKIGTSFFGGIAPWSLTIAANVIPIVWIPIGILLASVKQGDYSKLVNYFPKTLGRVLPQTLRERTITVLNFITDYTSTFIRVGMVVGMVALAHYGFVAYSCVLAGTWLFHEIDMRGYLPRKVSLFAESYLPIISSACLLVAGGTVILQVVAALNLITAIPFANRLLTHKVDSLMRYMFSIPGVSLEEYEAPLVDKGDLSYEEINAILNSNESDYEINPAHCSKSVIDLDAYPRDYDFDQLLKMFDAIKWNPKIIKNKLKDDDRFLDDLRAQYPGKEPKEQCARLNDSFFMNWMKNEFTQCVKALKGEVRPKGEQQDLAVAIDYASMIVTYLKNPKLSPVEKEDILLKCAVEAGGYCARGLKRAMGEIVDEAILTSLDERASFDLKSNYERATKQQLQNKRRDIVQYLYSKIVAAFPEQVTGDVHGYDIYRKYLSLGFYPLTPQERAEMSVLEILIWGVYSLIQHYEMLPSYHFSLDDAIHERETQFSTYMLQYIQSNKKLSEEQKEALLEKWTERNDGQWTERITLEKMHRVLLVKLGILKRATPA